VNRDRRRRVRGAQGDRADSGEVNVQRYARLDEVPAYQIRPERIPAPYWRGVRRLLWRHGGPVRFPLPGLAGLEMILQSDAWVVVEVPRHDLPVVAWTAFGRITNLQAPLECELRYYHLYGTAVTGRALHALDAFVRRRLGASWMEDGTGAPV